MANMYMHTFEVSGVLSFPLDMLRYDCCSPEGPDDVDKIAASVRRDERLQHYYIRLRAIGRKDWNPTTARWASFSWVVTPGSHVSRKIEG